MGPPSAPAAQQELPALLGRRVRKLFDGVPYEVRTAWQHRGVQPRALRADNGAPRTSCIQDGTPSPVHSMPFDRTLQGTIWKADLRPWIVYCYFIKYDDGDEETASYKE